MHWNIDFISHEDFKNHVKATILHYGSKLKPYNVEKFNSNIVDPIKMVFDRAVYGESWQQIISNEIFRQRDKSNTNEIGYFHQRLFEYIENCHVPANGQEGGWDVIYDTHIGYTVDEGNTVHKIYVEMKNKHNTMNSASSGKTYIKMQHQLLNDDDCACFLVEAIAKKSQNIVWETTVNGEKVSHRKIRRVSIDKFYEIVTGQSDAFYKICMALPAVVDEVLREEGGIAEKTHDTVYSQIEEFAKSIQGVPEDQAMIMSMYMLGFNTYLGFRNHNIDEH
ncbi:Eco47II family restriction endonuclease [Alloscardovia omnicolens]|uniref:Eco47II family restriction endonuclease n=1 Tax=Alloscardovia omnicolens TaxID=419015 RepID=UPI003A6FD1D4